MKYLIAPFVAFYAATLGGWIIGCVVSAIVIGVRRFCNGVRRLVTNTFESPV